MSSNIPVHPLEQQIIEQMERYLAGQISPREFTWWVLARVPHVKPDSPESLLNLIGDITVSWAEITDGTITEDIFRDDMREILDEYRQASHTMPQSERFSA